MSLSTRALLAAALALSGCSTLPPPIKDTIPPVVSALKLSGDLTPRSHNAFMTVEASDNVGVTRVDFFSNTTFFGSVTSAPYTMGPVTVPSCGGLAVNVYDAAGHATYESGPYVCEDPLPPSRKISTSP